MDRPIDEIRAIVEHDEDNERRAEADNYEDNYRIARERDDYREMMIPELVWLMARHIASTKGTL